jgi:hypothetical protein
MEDRMRRLFVVLVLLAAATVTAEELTVGTILAAKRAGADASGLVKLINDPAYSSVKVSPTELESLRAAGVPDEAILALKARMPVPTPAPAPTTPDDARLVDIARLVKSGLSESLIIDQIKGTSQAFDLTVNDLVYLKENGVSEPIIKELLSSKAKAGTAPMTAAAAAAGTAAKVPAPPQQDVTLESIVLVKPTFLKKNRPGRLVVKADEIAWMDGTDPKENFSFKPSGVEKVWFTCQARANENFCFQLNVQIVKGARYRFQDMNRETGSNDSVKKFEDAIRSRFPNVVFGPPDVDS